MPDLASAPTWVMTGSGVFHSEPAVGWGSKIGNPTRRPNPFTGTTGVVVKKGSKEERGEIYRRVYRTQDTEGRIVEVAKIDVRKLTAGRYRLTCEVRDTTEWVIRDPEGRLRDERQWILRIRK